MQHDKTEHEGARDALHRRRITLKDGRYMLFYTFGDEGEASHSAPSASDKEAVEPDNEAGDKSV